MSPTRHHQQQPVRRRGVPTAPRERQQVPLQRSWLRATASRECPCSYSSDDCIRVLDGGELAIALATNRNYATT
jgi:hypothetical protein